MREIRVRLLFRILAGLICVGYVGAIFYDTGSLWEAVSDDLVSLAAPFVVLPLFLYVTFVGKLPNFLVDKMSDEVFNDIARTETLFKKFDARSIGAAIVVLIMGCYMIMSRSS